MASYSFFLPNYRPPSLNQLFAGKLRDRIRRKKECYEIIAGYFMQAKIPKATGKRRVDMEMHLSSRQRKADPDAIWKVLLDGLVRCGALVDDDVAHVQLGEVSYPRVGECGTKITLTEIAT